MWYTRQKSIRRFADWNARIVTPHLTPNLISVQRLLFTPVMLALFVGDEGWRTAVGGVVFLFLSYLDFFDGSVARYQENLVREGRLPRHAPERRPAWLWTYGESRAGARLDPFSDKVVVWTALFALGWGTLPRWLLMTGVLLAAALTVIRFEAVRTALRRFVPVGDGRANGFGKMKMWVESGLVLALLLSVPGTGHLLAAAVLLAGLSLLFQLMPAKTKTTP